MKKQTVMMKLFAAVTATLTLSLSATADDVVPEVSTQDSPNFHLIYEDVPSELRFTSADSRATVERMGEAWDRIFEMSEREDYRDELKERRLLPIPSREQVDSVFESGVLTRFISGPEPTDKAFLMTQTLLGSPATAALSNLRDDVGMPEDNYRTGITYMVHLMCYIAIVFCSFFIGYIFIAGLIKSTKDGEFMGDWDTTFIMVRTGIGTMGIIPLSRYGGLSLSQVIVLTTFLMGIGAGSTIMSLMARELMTNPIVSASLPKQEVHRLAQDIVDMQICGLVQHDVSQTLPNPISATVWRNQSGQTRIEPFVSILQINNLYNKDLRVDIRFNAQDAESCGRITQVFPDDVLAPDGVDFENESGIFGGIGSDPELRTATQDGYISLYFKQALGYELMREDGPVIQLWLDLLPLTKLAVGSSHYSPEHALLSGRQIDPSDLSIPDIADIAPMIYWHAIDKYQMAVNEAVAKAASGEEMQKINQQMFDMVDSQGMMYGGAYYHLITRQQNAMAQAVENSTPSTTSINLDRLMRSGWYGDLYRGFVRFLRRVQGQESEVDRLVNARTVMDSIIESSAGSSTTTASQALTDYNNLTSADTGIGQFLASVSMALADGLQSIPRMYENSSRANPDPLLEIQSMGTKIQQAASIYVLMKSITGDSPLNPEDGDGESGGDNMAARVMASILSALIMLFIGISILYTSIIPMLPYVMFTISVLGLFTYLLKALVAAPLWWVQHTHPKGDDLVGQAAAGWKLLAGLYLRPPLMVMGLLGAMALIRPFGAFINESMGPSVRIMQDGLTGYSIVTHLLGYGIVMLLITYKTFSLIYELQQTVLGWVGVGDSYTDFGEKEAQFKVVGLGALASQQIQSSISNAGKK